jgi:hypothetical protein
MRLFLLGIKPAFPRTARLPREATCNLIEGFIMEESKIEAVTAQVQSRRAFVKTAAKVAVTAPAAALLLNASVKPAMARTEPYRGNTPGPGDDQIVTSDDGFDDVFVTPGDDFIP